MPVKKADVKFPCNLTQSIPSLTQLKRPPIDYTSTCKERLKA
jgi:hypothetical protein